jgi:adenosylcobinamide amidohydrolase
VIRVALERPWLIATLDAPHRALGWAPHRPGFVTTDRIAWREVRDADLTRDFDAIAWLRQEMAGRGLAEAVGLLTSRDLGRYSLETACSSLISASCLATVGLSNAERVGHRQGRPAPRYGTINVLAVTDAPLSDTALIELLSIATEARTAAVMEHGPDLETGRVTGTGTDCIVVAAPPGPGVYAGLHTDVGEAVGAAVHRAVARGVADWMEEHG